MPNHASPQISTRAQGSARPAPSARPEPTTRPAPSARPAASARSSHSGRPAAGAPGRRPRGILTGSAAILTAAVLWGTTGTASTLAPAGASPAAIGSAGLAAGGLLLFLTSRGARSLPAACTGAQRWLLALGALAVAGYPATFYPAVSRAGVAVATVIALGSAPVFAGLLAWATGHGRPSARWTAATGAAVLGCGALVLGPFVTGHGGHADGTGVVLALLAGLCYASYSLIGRRLITAGHPAGPVMGAMFGAAALLALALLVASGTDWLGTVRGVAVALHLAVFTTFVAYRLFGRGLRSTPAQAATTLTLAEAAVAAVLGVVALRERLPAVSWCGLAVLALGLAFLTVPARRRGSPGPDRPGSP